MSCVITHVGVLMYDSGLDTRDCDNLVRKTYLRYPAFGIIVIDSGW